MHKSHPLLITIATLSSLFCAASGDAATTLTGLALLERSPVPLLACAPILVASIVAVSFFAVALQPVILD